MSKEKEKFYSLPIHAFLETPREWTTAMSKGVDPEFSFRFGPPKRSEKDGTVTWFRDEPTRPSVFKVRQEFFDLETPQQARDFFTTYGPWERLRGTDGGASCVHFSTIQHQQDLFETALLRGEMWGNLQPRNTEEIVEIFQEIYLWSNVPMELVFRQTPEAEIRCVDVKEALRVSVFLSRLEGQPWRRCARVDCGKVFKLKSKHAMLYCDTPCAHLQSVRKYNDRKRAALARAKQDASKKA